MVALQPDLSAPSCTMTDVDSTQLTETKRVISFDHVGKVFGTVRAVDDVTATIHAGQIVGLIGPNGAGKTTLLRMLAGLAKPTSGSITILGSRPTVSSVRRSVGMVGARFPVPRRLNGTAVLAHIAALRQRSDIGRGEELADRLGLDLHRRADELSTGNRQKLALVQALMHHPQLLLLDEPTVGLDPVAQRTLNDMLREERATGTTIVMSSHVLSAVHTVATHVLAIRDGRVVIDGPIGPVLASTGRSVTARVPTNDVERITALLRDVEVTPHRGSEHAANEWTVAGRFHGDPNALIQELGRCRLLDLSVADPQLDDLVDDIYRSGGPR